MARKTAFGRRTRPVQLVFTIIETLQERDWISVTELAEVLEHLTSTIHSQLQTIEEEILVRDEEGISGV